MFDWLGDLDTKLMSGSPVLCLDLGDDSFFLLHNILNPPLESWFFRNLVGDCILSQFEWVCVLDILEWKPWSRTITPFHTDVPATRSLLGVDIAIKTDSESLLYISTRSGAYLDNQYQDFLIPLLTLLNMSIISTQIFNFHMTTIT